MSGASMTTPVQDIIVDARGHRCPTPTLRLRRAVERAFAGARLQLLADDPMAKIDVPHYVGEAGLERLAISQDGPVATFLIRKP